MHLISQSCLILCNIIEISQSLLLSTQLSYDTENRGQFSIAIRTVSVSFRLSDMSLFVMDYSLFYDRIIEIIKKDCRPFDLRSGQAVPRNDYMRQIVGGRAKERASVIVEIFYTITSKTKIFDSSRLS